MKLKTIDKLCCPFDKRDLSLEVMIKDQENNVIEGILTCEECNRYYPIVCGVPVMSPDAYREKDLELPVVSRWQNQLKQTSSND